MQIVTRKRSSGEPFCTQRKAAPLEVIFRKSTVPAAESLTVGDGTVITAATGWGVRTHPHRQARLWLPDLRNV
jgi:hypothetical protein